MSLGLKVTAGLLVLSVILGGVTYIQHVRYQSLERSHADLKNTLVDLQSQVQAAETARLNLANRLVEVERRRVTSQTIIKEVPVQPEETVVSDVLKRALQEAKR